jgi:adenylosuccinate lyase
MPTARRTSCPPCGSCCCKEVAVFLARLLPLYRSLRSLVFQGKLNGATGNYSAMVAALPHFDWVALEERFVRSLGLEPDLATTQIEPHDRWITYFDLTRHINAVLLGLDLDFWLYISYGYFRQVATSGQVGSSTMPHKVNPIRFENSEGNLELSNAILGRLAEKLGRSRMQRDLSDTTLERNIGVALAHAQLAWSESTAAVKALELDETATRSELEAHPELLAEAIQTILRTIGWDDPYELLRRATQGHPLTTAELQTFLAGLGLPPKVAERCRALRPAEYVGLAPEICRRVLAEADRELSTS